MKLDDCLTPCDLILFQCDNSERREFSHVSRGSTQNEDGCNRYRALTVKHHRIAEFVIVILVACWLPVYTGANDNTLSGRGIPCSASKRVIQIYFSVSCAY